MKSLFITFIINYILISFSNSTNYYISQTGSGDQSGISLTNMLPITNYQSFENLLIIVGDNVNIYFCGVINHGIIINISGKKDNPIVYRGDCPNDNRGSFENVGDSPIIINGVQNHIVIKRLKMDDCSKSWIVIEPGCSYITIEECDLNNACSWGGIQFGSYGTVTSYLRIRNNYLRASAKYTGESESCPGDLIAGTMCQKCVIENNVFGNVGHHAISISRGVGLIYRNNTIENKWHTGMSSYSPVQSTKYALIERNLIKNCGKEKNDNPRSNCCEPCVNKPTGGMYIYDYLLLRFYFKESSYCGETAHSGAQLTMDYGIFRRNVIYNCGRSLNLGAADGDIKDSAFYHNSFLQNPNRAKSMGLSCHTNYGSNGKVDRFVFKNNILSWNLNWNPDEYDIKWATDDGSLRATFDSNVIGKETGTVKIRYQPHTSCLTCTSSEIDGITDDWTDTYEYNPEYNDPENDDFTLKSTSELINRGTHLTLATNDGINSKLLQLPDGDTKFFFTGEFFPWEIEGEEADYIYIEGTTKPVQIKSYTGNQITLSEDTTWSVDAKIWIALDKDTKFIGDSPDIGAFEYGYVPKENNDKGGLTTGGYIAIFTTGGLLFLLCIIIILILAIVLSCMIIGKKKRTKLRDAVNSGKVFNISSTDEIMSVKSEVDEELMKSKSDLN